MTEEEKANKWVKDNCCEWCVNADECKEGCIDCHGTWYKNVDEEPIQWKEIVLPELKEIE